MSGDDILRTSFVQKPVKRSVFPLDPLTRRQLLEPVQVFLRNSIASLLIRRIAIVDPAGERPGLARRTKVPLLKGAKFFRRWLAERGGIGHEHVRFEIAQEEGVAIFLEPAAAAAGDTNGTGDRDFLVHVFVQVQHLLAEFGRHEIVLE
jgi:hypothetical protein